MFEYPIETAEQIRDILQSFARGELTRAAVMRALVSYDGWRVPNKAGQDGSQGVRLLEGQSGQWWFMVFPSQRLAVALIARVQLAVAAQRCVGRRQQVRDQQVGPEQVRGGGLIWGRKGVGQRRRVGRGHIARPVITWSRGVRLKSCGHPVTNRGSSQTGTREPRRRMVAGYSLQAFAPMRWGSHLRQATATRVRAIGAGGPRSRRSHPRATWPSSPPRSQSARRCARRGA